MFLPKEESLIHLSVSITDFQLKQKLFLCFRSSILFKRKELFKSGLNHFKSTLDFGICKKPLFYNLHVHALSYTMDSKRLKSSLSVSICSDITFCDDRESIDGERFVVVALFYKVI